MKSRRFVAWFALACLVAGLGWWLRPNASDHETSWARAAAPRGTSSANGVSNRSSDTAARLFEGTVVDSEGEPLLEGSLSFQCVEDEQTKTLPDVVSLAEAAAFKVRGCGNYVCPRLHHPRYEAADAWEVEPSKPAVLRARVRSTLEAMILGPEGQALVGAQVFFLPPEGGDEGALLPVTPATTHADADGHISVAQIRRPPCDLCQEHSEMGCTENPLRLHESLRALVMAKGLRPTEFYVDLEIDRDTPLEWRLHKKGERVGGSLHDPHGRPFPRARVLARSSLRAHEQHVVDASSGEFEFDSLGEGAYTFRALQDGLGLANSDTPRLIGPVLLDELRLTLTEQGTPVPGAIVAGGPFVDARADATGSVEATYVAVGSYRLHVEVRGQKTILGLSVVAGQTRYTLDLASDRTDVHL